MPYLIMPFLVQEVSKTESLVDFLHGILCDLIRTRTQSVLSQAHLSLFFSYGASFYSAHILDHSVMITSFFSSLLLLDLLYKWR